MKIGIVGWGIEGQSVFKFFGSEHSYLIVNEHPRDDFPPQSDKIKVQYLTAQKPPGITGNAQDLSYLDGIQNCDKIVYTPTARKNLEQRFGDSREFWAKTTSALHIFFETVQTRNIIGVTGTKGKGTTSTLIYQMLQAAGQTVYFGGNVGRSVLDFVKDVKPEDWVVLELSNFQLYKFPYSPHIAVCLMVVPEHLDWHPNNDDYLQAKANIFAHQKPDDIAVYYADNEYSRQLAELSPGLKIPYYQAPGARLRQDGQIVIGHEEVPIANKNSVKLLGEHNLQNICAAVTAVWFSLSKDEGQTALDVKVIQKILGTFSGLEHRLEFVRELHGVKYYDDSFGTTPETAIVAIKAFSQPKVVILGGSDKGLPYDILVDEVLKNNVRAVIAIGVTGPKIAELLRQRSFTSITEGLSNMQDIVKAAQKVTQEGDAVLLSAGSASFGLFHDYKDRGDQFKQAVQELA